MGKQYNYYVSPEEEKEFAQYLFDNGFLILAPKILKDDNGNIELDWTIDNLQQYNNMSDYNKFFSDLYMTCIYKKEWGQLIVMPDKCVDWQKSPVIDYMYSQIDESMHCLLRGRFYLDTRYKDEIENFDAVYKDYRKIVRVMKKI